MIIRNSSESSVTIPFEQTFRDLETARPSPNNIQAYDAFNFCGCGWPEHLLVPKGTRQGYPMDMFVMVSNYDLDKVLIIFLTRKKKSMNFKLFDQ